MPKVSLYHRIIEFRKYLLKKQKSVRLSISENMGQLTYNKKKMDKRKIYILLLFNIIDLNIDINTVADGRAH